MTTILANNDHVEIGVDRLFGRSRGKKNVEAVLRSYLQQVQDLEDLVHAVIDGRNLDVSEGEQLEFLGKLVGQSRTTPDDELFRIAIRARILINRSNGTLPELLRILRAILVQGEEVAAREEYPLQIRFWIKSPLAGTANAYWITALLSEARIGGCRILVVWEKTGGRRFRFSRAVGGVPANPARGGFGTVYTGGVNAGQLNGVVDG